MIGTLNGTVLQKGVDVAVVDVGGVGYQVMLNSSAMADLPEVGEKVLLHIHTHVREDAILLFGFLNIEEKELFLKLITVSGVGPRLGLAMVAGLPVGELHRAIVAGDIKRLTALPGIGKKTAERICMELRDSLGAAPLRGMAFDGGMVLAAGEQSAAADAVSALVNLGYGDALSRRAVLGVKQRLGDETFSTLAVEDLLKECLRSLA
jgi:Holliday junction DNA helicase RuvA